MDFLRGNPLFNDVAFAVDDLDGRAFQFFAAGNVYLADLDVGVFVCECYSAFILNFHNTARRHNVGTAVRQDFLHTVLDLLAVFVHRQAGPFVSPAVRGANSDCCTFSNTVLVQLHGRVDILTAVILVVAVIPDLIDFNPGIFRRIAVCQRGDLTVHTGVSQLVAFRQARFIFGPGVFNLNTSSVLRQILNRCCPAVRLVQRDTLSIAQYNSQALRPLAILVVFVVPDLHDGRFGLFRCMAVGPAAFVALGIRCIRRITVNRVFGEGVLNLHACFILRQVRRSHSIGVLLVRRYRDLVLIGLSDIFLARQQMDLALVGSLIRTDAILVVSVVPGLRYLQAGRSGCIAVRQAGNRSVHAGIGQSVAFRQTFFRPGIPIVLQISIHSRQVIHRSGPFVIFTQDNAGIFGSVLQQIHCQFFRTLAILVIRVVPDLTYSD